MKISERRRMVQVFIGVIVNQSQSFEPKTIYLQVGFNGGPPLKGR
jgi:hypothetical protein